MGTSRQPATIATALATTARTLRRAVHATDPAVPPGPDQLRETGWQLIQLTGELTDLVTVLAEHTGQHTQHPHRIIRAGGDTPATASLARACRELATLRQALDTAHTAARDYYTAISHLSPAGPEPLRPSP
ncbi:hypothetical protein [Amycolatopsis sp. FDAARGOS 1241]|uniref:hypothetical protein n=1 Tax=Amycolatopsis sp. FDAARGOS 1241 TaxID=2778070 RepID=UPI00195255DF|nr:hypothetical protein [Amycolatopsis sp. FDAARGOS 1241]QRP42818.1 hypothetical protein I6J71_25475 [Amycolatopsis sp. FDAARGOS 1241]